MLPIAFLHTQEKKKHIMPHFSTDLQRTLQVGCDVHLFVLELSHGYDICIHGRN